MIFELQTRTFVSKNEEFCIQNDELCRDAATDFRLSTDFGRQAPACITEYFHASIALMVLLLMAVLGAVSKNDELLV